MFTFYIENHEPFGSLTNNCPKLDKNKSIADVSIFVSECLYLFLDISIKSTNCIFRARKKFPPTITLSFSVK